MTDRELLEAAAKAAGIKGREYLGTGGLVVDWNTDRPSDATFVQNGTLSGWYWNPLTSDGDAFRLAVKLRLDIDHHKDSVNVWESYFGTGFIPNGDDPCAATRRAIVRAAAALGEATP